MSAKNSNLFLEDPKKLVNGGYLEERVSILILGDHLAHVNIPTRSTSQTDHINAQSVAALTSCLTLLVLGATKNLRSTTPCMRRNRKELCKESLFDRISTHLLLIQKFRKRQ